MRIKDKYEIGEYRFAIATIDGREHLTLTTVVDVIKQGNIVGSEVNYYYAPFTLKSVVSDAEFIDVCGEWIDNANHELTVKYRAQIVKGKEESIKGIDNNRSLIEAIAKGPIMVDPICGNYNITYPSKPEGEHRGVGARILDKDVVRTKKDDTITALVESSKVMKERNNVR